MTALYRACAAEQVVSKVGPTSVALNAIKASDTFNDSVASTITSGLRLYRLPKTAKQGAVADQRGTRDHIVGQWKMVSVAERRLLQMKIAFQ
jgi:hypothetical protein